MNEEFFKKPFINAWSVTNSKSNHRVLRNAEQGDVAFIYNDPQSPTGRNINFIPMNSWYFYIKNTGENLDFLTRHKFIKYQLGKNWIRIYCKNKEYKDPNVKELVRLFEDNKIQTYEADISPMKRLCLDHDVKIENWENIRILYFDIETDDSNKLIDATKNRILSFAGVDRHGKEYYLTHKDERELLYQIDDLIVQFDMLIGWNSKNFDLPYLKERYKKHGVPTDYLWNVLHEDMMKRVYYFYTRDPENRQAISSYSLESISQHFLKEGKKKYKGKIIDLFNNEPETLKVYNINDCHLLRKLEEKLGTIELTYKLFQTCQIFAQNWSMVKAIDNFILSEANKTGVHYKTNPWAFMDNREEENEADVEYLGAVVFDPIPGYYENVNVLDFKSLYPNIIRTFNISPETLLPEYYKIDGKIEQITIPTKVIEDKTHGGYLYQRDQIGIIPGKIGILLDERNKIKASMKGLDKKSNEYKDLHLKQLVVKELANSVYGVLGNKYFREFNTNLSESITTTGQYLITWVKDYLEKTGRKVIYGDTDSVFIQTKDKEGTSNVLDEVNKELTNFLKVEFNIRNSSIELAFDTKFDQFIIESKKKYVGKNEEKTKFVGMECVKRDTIPIAVEAQKELIELIFNRKSLLTIKKWINNLKNKIIKKDFDIEKFVIRKRLSKDPDSYKAKTVGRTYTAPIHVKLAKVKGYKSGDIVKYIVVDAKNGKLNEVVIPEEYNGKLDCEYYWNNSIYPILERLLKTVSPKYDWEEYYIVPEKKVESKQKTIFDEIEKEKKKTKTRTNRI